MSVLMQDILYGLQKHRIFYSILFIEFEFCKNGIIEKFVKNKIEYYQDFILKFNSVNTYVIL